MKNRTFQHALLALSHPVTLLAVVTLLVNNHVLRHTMPSWWTGKLGDVAWLTFAPAMFAAVLSWLLPPRLPRHEQIVGYTAFILVGAGFALANTVPLFNSWSNWLLQRLSGWQPSLVRDPTDLLALPGILVGWYIWQKCRNASAPFTARGWVVLSIAVLSTAASEPGPKDFGVQCLVEQEGLLTAYGSLDAFVSKDGGLVWNLAPSNTFERYQSECAEQVQRNRGDDGQWELVDPSDHQIIYRFEPGEGIAKSADGGQTWSTDVELPSWTQAQARHYTEFNSQGPPAYYTRRPYDAIFHSDSGNLVVSMGYEGALVRIPGGEWRWIDIGPYRHVEPRDLDFVKPLLGNEFWLGLLYAALVGLTITGYTSSPSKRKGRGSQIGWLVLTGPAWLFWLGAVFSLDYDPRQYPLENLGPWLLKLASGGYALLMLVMVISRLRSSFGQTRQALKRAAITAVVGCALFLLPYVLWTQGDIPYYSNAIRFAILLALATVAGGFYWTKDTPAEAPAETNAQAL